MNKTNEVKHTPGPWTVEPMLVPEWEDDPMGVYRVQPASDKLATAYRSVPFCQDAENQANARLIAAAPELLEACAFFLKWADMQSEKGNDVPYQLKKAMLSAHTKATLGENASEAYAAIANAETAIQTATGRTPMLTDHANDCALNAPADLQTKPCVQQSAA